MNPSSLRNKLSTGLALIVLLAGCAEPTVKTVVVDPVNQTLQAYQVGVTTFNEFKGDAGLRRTKPATKSPANPPHSYLADPWLTQSLFTNQASPTVYVTLPGSPWKIYETGETVTIINGYRTQVWKFVVGNTNQPISILTFNERGCLTKIASVPATTP